MIEALSGHDRAGRVVEVALGQACEGHEVLCQSFACEWPCCQNRDLPFRGQFGLLATLNPHQWGIGEGCCEVCAVSAAING